MPTTSGHERQRLWMIGISVALLASTLSVASTVSFAAASVDSISAPDPGEVAPGRIDNPRTTLTTGGDPSIQLDESGNPIVAYTDFVDGSGGLRVLHCDDPACSGTGETVSMIDGPADGNYVSMELNAEGHPVIVFQGVSGAQPNPGDLRMIQCNDPACAGGDDDVQILISEGVFRFAELRLDSDDNPVILFRSFVWPRDPDVSGMNVLRCNDPLCAGNDESIASLRYVNRHRANGRASFELDPAGNPVIAYSGQFDGFNGPESMTLVQCNDPNCVGNDEAETFLGEMLSHPDVALLLLGDDYEIVVAAVKFNFQAVPRQWRFGLHASRCLASNCEPEQFSFPETVVGSPAKLSLALSPDGPVVSYTNNDILRVALLRLDNPSGFEPERDISSMAPDLDSEGVIKPSIVLDAAGGAAIAYLADGALKVARCSDAGCAPTCNGLTVTIDMAAGDRGTPFDDVIRGTGEADRIWGRSGNDVICGLGGDDLIDGGGGFDKIFAGSGDDTINGNIGNDRLVGGPGNDTITGDVGNDRIFGGSGHDQLSGGRGHDRISGGGGNDHLLGGSGNDLMFGNLGNDILSGDAGADVLRGGAWIDTVDGGDGDDRCALVPEDTVRLCERGVFGI